MHMLIDENKDYLLKSELLYRLGLSILGIIIIFDQWMNSGSTHILLLMLLLSLIFLFLIADYLLARSTLKLTPFHYLRVSFEYLGTGVFFAFIHFEYILILIIGFGCVLSLLLHKEKLLIYILLICLGAGITYWLLLPLINHWDPFVAGPIIITSALLLVGIYSMVLIIRGLQKHKRMVQRLSLATTENEELTNRIFQLSKYLSPTLRRAILSGVQLKDEPEEKQVTVFFSDIVGFTTLTEQLSSEDLTSFINTYLAEMSKIAARFGGTIDKIMGDAVMVFFGDPESRGIKNDAVSCVSMALAMKKSMTELQLRWQKKGMGTLPSIRIGINSGLCKVGNFGSSYYINYTLLGRTVNLASRLESAANAEEILISQSTYDLVKDRIHCISKDDVIANGFSQPLPAYGALSLIQHDKQTLSYETLLDPQANVATGF